MIRCPTIAAVTLHMLVLDDACAWEAMEKSRSAAAAASVGGKGKRARDGRGRRGRLSARAR